MKYLALNLKAYNESTGENALRLLKAAEQALQENASFRTKVELIICPQTLDLHWLSQQSKRATQLFAQHCDANAQGAFTGSTTALALKTAGCSGTLLNHSEKRIPLAQAGETIKQCNSVGLRVIACAKDVEEGVALAALGPWAVAVEPPELIGSGISVSSAKPEIVPDAVKRIQAANRKTIVLVGAGVSNAGDAAKCIELGAEGVLLASAFVKAKDPLKWLNETLEAMSR